MTENDFQRGVSDLTEASLASAETFIRNKGMKFDKKALLDQGSTDIDQFARDVFFFGADTYPE